VKAKGGVKCSFYNKHKISLHQGGWGDFRFDWFEFSGVRALGMEYEARNIG